MIDKDTEIKQAQQTAQNYLLNPTQAQAPDPNYQPPPTIAEYEKTMYTPNDTGTKAIDKFTALQQQTQLPSYTDWYEANNKQHVPGYEIEGRLQLKSDQINKLSEMYQKGDIGYQTFLMESVGYDLMERSALNFRPNDANWWYNRYLVNDFSDPREDTQLLSEFLTLAETTLAESEFGKLINFGGKSGSLINEMLGEYRSGDFATDETMSQFFAGSWEEAKAQFEGDVEKAIQSLRGHTQMGRVNEDGTKYIHTDGRIYDIVGEDDPAYNSRQQVAAVKYNEDGTIDSIRLRGNELTGSVLIDNTVSGAAGFMIDLGKVVSQVVAGVVDIGEGAVTGDWEFDKVIDTGLAFEGFKASNAITAKAYIDMDGFEANNFTDWMATTGDIAGLLLGMYLTAGIGGGLNTAGASIAQGGGIVATGLGKTVSFSGKLLSSVSNLHNGSATKGFQSALASRTAFSMTHASKDALSTYTYRKLAGASENDAWKSAGAVFLTNTAITMAIGSGSKDDTFRMYRGMTRAIGKRMPLNTLLKTDLGRSVRLLDASVTAGLDFFDNYLTMTIAAQAEQTGQAGLAAAGKSLTELFSGEADFSQVLTAGVFASNAFRGVMNDYRTGTIPNRALGSTAERGLKALNDVIDNPKSTPEQISSAASVRAEYYSILSRSEEDGGGLLNALDFLHKVGQKENGQSLISKTLAKSIKDFDIEAYKEIGKVVQEYQDAHIEQAGSWLYRVFNQGFIRGTFSKLKDWDGAREVESFKQLLQSEAQYLTSKVYDQNILDDPLAEAHRIMFGRDMTAEDEKAKPNLFEDTKLFNPKNFKHSRKNNVYRITLEGKGTLDSDPEWRTMQMILNRMADEGLIKRATDDKSGTVFELPASMGKMTHAAQAIYDMYEGLLMIRNLGETAPSEDIIKIANKIKNIIRHGKDQIEPDQPIKAVEYLIRAEELGYIRTSKMLDVMDKMLSDKELRDLTNRNDSLGAHAEAVLFMRKANAGDPITITDAPASGSEAEKLIVKAYPQRGPNIAKQVDAINERVAKSPQSFASTLDSTLLRGVEEGLEVALEADTILNPKFNVVNVFKSGDGKTGFKSIDRTVKKEVKDRLIANGTIKESEWTSRTLSAARKEEILREMVKLQDIEGYEDYRKHIIDSLAIADTYRLLYDTVKRNGVTLKTETFQIAKDQILIDKAQFVPRQLFEAYELISQYKQNAETIGEKNTENLVIYLQKNGVDVAKLENEIVKWNNFMSSVVSDSRFISVRPSFLEQFGYTAKEFTGSHTTKYPGIINGNVLTKGFQLSKKIKKLNVRIEPVTVTGVIKEQYRVHAAAELMNGRFEITNDTILSPGEIGLLFGAIRDNRITGNGWINKFVSRMKATTLGGKGFIGQADRIRGEYNEIEMGDEGRQLMVNKAVYDIVKNFEEHPVLRTKLKFDEENSSHVNDYKDYIGRYYDYEEVVEDGKKEIYITRFKTEVVESELNNDESISLRQLLLFDFIPDEKFSDRDILNKGLQRVVINAEGKLYESLSYLEDDFAVRLIQEAIAKGGDESATKYDDTPYQLKSNRVGDIIADLEAKATAEGDPEVAKQRVRGQTIRKILNFIRGSEETEVVLKDGEFFTFRSLNASITRAVDLVLRYRSGEFGRTARDRQEILKLIRENLGIRDEILTDYIVGGYNKLGLSKNFSEAITEIEQRYGVTYEQLMRGENLPDELAADWFVYLNRYTSMITKAFSNEANLRSVVEYDNYIKDVDAGKILLAGGLTPTEQSLLRLLKHYRVDAISTENKLSMDYDLLRRSQQPGTTVDDLVLYLKQRQEVLPELGEIGVFNKNYLDNEFNLVVDPRDLRNLDVIYTYDLNDSRFLTKLQEMLNDVEKIETTFSTNYKVIDEDRWKSLVFEVDGKQYIDYESIFKADEEMIDGLRQNLSKEDLAKFDLFMDEMNKLIGRTENKDDFVYQWRKAITSTSQPSIQEDINFLLRGIQDTAKLDELVDRADAQLKYENDRFRFNQFDKAFNRGYELEEKNRFVQMKDVIKEGAFNSMYRNFFDGKDNPELYEELQAGAKYIFLDEKGDIVYVADGKTDFLDLVKYQDQTFKNARYVVGADLYTKSFFEEYKMNIIDLESKRDGVSYKKRLQEYGDYNITEWLAVNRQQLRDVLNDVPTYRNAYKKDPNSELGLKYKEYIEEVNNYIDTRLSTRKKVSNSVTRLVTGSTDEPVSAGDRKLVKTLVGLLERNFYNPVSPAATKDDLFFYNYLRNQEPDARITNAPAATVLEAIINGVDIQSLDPDARTFIDNKLAAYKTEYTKGIDTQTLEDAEDYVAAKVQQLNDPSKKTPKEIPVPESLKALDEKQLQGLIFALTMEQDVAQGVNANTYKFLLNRNTADAYSFDSVRQNFEEGLRFDFEDKYELATRNVYVLDVEAIVDDINNVNESFALSVSLRPVDFNNNEVGESQTYRFAVDETASKRFYNKTIAAMEANRTDVSGLKADYEASTKVDVVDQREELRGILLGIIRDNNSLVLAHNGAEFDFSKILTSLYKNDAEILEALQTRNKTFVDSIEVLREMSFKSIINYTRSNIEAYRRNALKINPDDEILKRGADHSAAGDTELLAKILLTYYGDARNGVAAPHGKMFGEMDNIFRSITGKDFDFTPKPMEIADDGYYKTPVDFFGLNTTYNKLTELQQVKAFRDYLFNRDNAYRVYRDEQSKGLINYKLTQRAESLLERNGIDNIAKISSFLLDKDSQVQGSNLNNKFMEYIVGNKKPQQVIEDLLDSSNYSRESFTNIFGEEGNKLYDEYIKYNFNSNRAQDKTFSTDMMNQVERAPIKQHDYLFQRMFNLLDNQLNFIEDDYKTNILQAMAESYRNHFTIDEKIADTFEFVAQELEILPYINHAKRIRENADIRYKEIFDALGNRSTVTDSTYGNARYLELNKEYVIQTSEGTTTRKLQANEIGITKDTANKIFGDEYNPDDLYGWILRYPSDRPNSFLPMKYVVVDSELKGNQYLIDDNVMLSIQGDFDGDKFSLFGNQNPNTNEALKFLNEKYLQPYVQIRNELESRPIIETANDDSISRFYLRGVEIYEAFKAAGDKEGYFNSLFKNTTIDEKDIKDFKTFIREFDENKLGSIQVQKFLRQQALKNDQQKGMFQKSLTEGEYETYLRTSEEYYADRNNWLTRGGTRDVTVTDRTVELLKNRGMSDEEIARLVLDNNNNMLRDITTKESNEEFAKLIDAIDEDGEARKTFNTAMDVAKKFDELNDEILNLDKDNYFFAGNELRPELLQETVADLLRIENMDVGNVVKLESNFGLLNQNRLRILVLDDKDAALIPPDTYGLTSRFENEFVSNKLYTLRQPEGYSKTNEVLQRTNFNNVTVKNAFKTKAFKNQLTNVMIGKMVAGGKAYFGNEDQFNAQYFQALKRYYSRGVNAKNINQLRTALQNVKTLLDQADPPFKETVLKELIFLNGINRGKVGATTKVSDLPTDQTLRTWTENTYNEIDDTTNISQVRVFETEFEYVPALEEMSRYLNTLSDSKRIPVYRGMPIFIRGNDVKRSPINGLVELTDEGAIFIQQDKVSSQAIKLAAQQSAAFKSMPFGSVIDTDEFHIVISSANIKGSKLLPEQLRSLDVIGEKQSYTIDGKTYNGTVIDSDVYALENIVNWNPSDERSGSFVVDNSSEGNIDVTSFLANVNSAMGRVLFNEGQVRQLVDFKNKYTPTPIVSRDMSYVMGNMKYQLILSVLTPEQRAELTGINADQKIKYGQGVANNIDIYLRQADLYLEEKGITTESIINRLLKDQDKSATDTKFKRMVQGVLEYNDYLDDTVVTVSGNKKEFSKGSPANIEREYVTRATRNNDYESAGSLIEVPRLKYMAYDDFMDRLGLYYNKVEDQQAFRLGYHKPGQHVSLGVNSKFRSVDPMFANRIENEAALNSIINSRKNGVVTVGNDNTYVIPSTRTKVASETNDKLLPVTDDSIYQDITTRAYDDEKDGLKNYNNYLVAKAMDTAREMKYFNNERNTLKFKAGINDRPIQTVQSEDHLYTSLNFAKDPETQQLKYTGVLNAGEVKYDLNDPKVVRVSSSADFFEQTRRTTRLEDVDLKRFTKPDTIIDVNFKPLGEESRSFTEDFDYDLKQYNDMLNRLDPSISRNQIDTETGEVLSGPNMLEPQTPVARSIFDLFRNNFSVKTHNKQDNMETLFTESRWRSQGIRYDSDQAFVIDSAIKNARSKHSYIVQSYSNKIGHLYNTIRQRGKVATEQFGQYYLFSRLLVDIKEKQSLNKLQGYEEIIPESYQSDIMNTFGVKTLDAAVKEMEAFVKEYNVRNAGVTGELFNIQKTLLNDYRTIANKTNSPIENSWALLFPILKDLSDNNDMGRSNFRTKKKIMFNPGKYDNPVDFLKLSDPTDVLKGMYRLAQDIAEMGTKLEFSADLISNGVIKNTEVVDLAADYLAKSFDEITSKEGRNVSNKLLTKMVGQLYENINREDAEYIIREYDKGMEAEAPSRHNVKILFNTTRNLINDLMFDVRQKFGPEIESLDDIRSQIRQLEDINDIGYLQRVENTISYIQEMYSVLIRNTDAAKEFKNALNNKAGSKFNVVDKFGRLMNEEVRRPLSESNMEFLEQSLRYQDNENWLSNALMGNLYLGNKSLTNILNKTLYKPYSESNIVKKALRKTAQTFTRFTFGNPFRIIRRLENWTFTDMWMVSMANPKAPLFLGQAGRELRQSINSDAKAVDPKLQRFQQLAGTTINTAQYVDFFTKETGIIKNPAQARNFVQKTFDVGLSALTFQHQLPRYALYLATLDDINKNDGKITSWGAAYRFKSFIDKLPTAEERAFRLMQINIASQGDFPIMVRDIAPYLLVTTFTLGQARWAADWGVSMKEAAMDVFKAFRSGASDAAKQDVPAALKTLAYPSVVTGLGASLGWMLLNFLADIYGADDETKEEWLEEGRYLEVVGTLINGAPTFTSSKASPVDIVFDDWIKTGQKGFEGSEYGVGTAAEGGIPGALAAYWNKHILGRVNPLFKIPVESFTGRNYFGEFATEDKYATNFIDNMLRKSLGMIVGTGTVNAYTDNMRFKEFAEDERGMAAALFNGMKDSIASEFGNTRAFKKDTKDFYFARSLIHNALDEEGYYEQMASYYAEKKDDPGELQYDPNAFNEDKAAELSTVFRSMMTREESFTTIYSIIQAELEKGTTISTIHAALNKVSVLREMNKLDNPEEFLSSLSEQDYLRVRNAVQFEQRMFPGIAEINLYDLVGSNRTARMPYISRPYYNRKYTPYKRYLPRMNYQSQVNFYNNMQTYHPYYEAASMFERWNPEEPQQRQQNNRNRNRRR